MVSTDMASTNMASTNIASKTRAEPSNRRIKVRPIAGALGAEISGVDLAGIDDATFAEVYDAWLDHQVVFFRDQKLTPEQQITFAKRFGDIHHHPFIKGMDDYPDILEIIKEEGDTRAFGETWHTDQMFNPKPAKATILFAKETPDAGGDTMFANMYQAYDSLSEPMKTMIQDIKTWNVGSRKKLSATDNHGSVSEGRYKGSPYDAFLEANQLPRAPANGESPPEYSRRLHTAIAALRAPRFVDDARRYSALREPRAHAAHL